MDLTILGRMGGQETMRKGLTFDPNAKGIVSSGYSNNPIMANCSNYGFKATSAKPCQLNELCKTITSVTGKPHHNDCS